MYGDLLYPTKFNGLVNLKFKLLHSVPDSTEPNLKGQCHKIFDNCFCFKDLTWAPYEQTKRFCKLFRFCKKIPEKMCPHDDTWEIILFWKK